MNKPFYCASKNVKCFEELKTMYPKQKIRCWTEFKLASWAEHSMYVLFPFIGYQTKFNPAKRFLYETVIPFFKDMPAGTATMKHYAPNLNYTKDIEIAYVFEADWPVFSERFDFHLSEFRRRNQSILADVLICKCWHGLKVDVSGVSADWLRWQWHISRLAKMAVASRQIG